MAEPSQPATASAAVPTGPIVVPVVAPAAALGSPRIQRLRGLVRGAALSLGLGLLSVFVFSLFADLLLGPLRAWLSGLALTDPSRAALALALLALVQALAVFAVLLVLGLVGDWPLRLGACAGALAGLLPALILLAGQGAAVLLPWTLLCVRATGVGLTALAGSIGLAAGRRLSRGHKPLNSG